MSSDISTLQLQTLLYEHCIHVCESALRSAVTDQLVHLANLKQFKSGPFAVLPFFRVNLTHQAQELGSHGSFNILFFIETS